MMWTIRQDQFDTFEHYQLKKFEDEMVAHLQDFTPKHWHAIGEPVGRQVVRLGIDHAGKYGFTKRGPVRFYIELMFILGSYFDTDPQYRWAHEILIDSGWTDEMDRAALLHSTTMEYISTVFGLEHDYLVAAMRRLTLASIAELIPLGPRFEDRIFDKLQTIYPQKCDFLGKKPVKNFVRWCFDIACHFGFVTDEGIIATILMAFAVGHGFYRDPICGWSMRTIDNQHWRTPEARSHELYSQSMIYISTVYLDQVLDDFVRLRNGSTYQQPCEAGR